jgi:hypothetical protein
MPAIALLDPVINGDEVMTRREVEDSILAASVSRNAEKASLEWDCRRA